MGDVLRRIGDALSDLVDKVDKFIEEERAFFRGLRPYKGEHRKRKTKPHYGEWCDGCMAPSYNWRDCLDCKRWKDEEEDV